LKRRYDSGVSDAAIEAVFRGERARVLATTIRASHGDFDLAEEAVQDAFAAALARWPGEGVPDDPRGWLVAVARHKAIDAIRRRCSRPRRSMTAARSPTTACA
jgi:RNA polymerase sigma-70 factor (ECF subfamily)